MKRVVLCLVGLMILSQSAWAADINAKALFDKKCKMCHSINGAGGPMAKMGGPLDDVGAKHDAAWLKAYFENPKSKNPKAKMPKIHMSDAEWNAMIQYMLTLKK